MKERRLKPVQVRNFLVLPIVIHNLENDKHVFRYCFLGMNLNLKGSDKGHKAIVNVTKEQLRNWLKNKYNFAKMLGWKTERIQKEFNVGASELSLLIDAVQSKQIKEF